MSKMGQHSLINKAKMKRGCEIILQVMMNVVLLKNIMNDNNTSNKIVPHQYFFCQNKGRKGNSCGN